MPASEELPEGRLGKTHVVYAGAAAADGEWLHFAYAERHGLDHLTLVLDLELKGYWLRSAIAYFWVAFLLHRGYYREVQRTNTDATPATRPPANAPRMSCAR
jgi:hypothetical protein